MGANRLPSAGLLRSFVSSLIYIIVIMEGFEKETEQPLSQGLTNGQHPKCSQPESTSL